MHDLVTQLEPVTPVAIDGTEVLQRLHSLERQARTQKRKVGLLLATTFLSGLMWHVALPQVPLVWLVLLATLQLLVTRLPFVPNKDLVFASLAIFLIGNDSEVATLIANVGVTAAQSSAAPRSSALRASRAQATAISRGVLVGSSR